ncbi:hypothetical protein D3C76_1103220 [compost metagenome]
MQPFDLSIGCQDECIGQVSLARPSVQVLLRLSLATAQEQAFVAGNAQAGTQPVRQHGRLVEATLAQAFARHGHGQQTLRPWQAFVETVFEPVAKQLRHESAQWPAAVVFETGDERVDGEGVMPGRLDPFEGRRVFAALPTRQAGHRQGQGAHLAALVQPRQFGFAGYAEWVGIVGALIAQQT